MHPTTDPLPVPLPPGPHQRPIAKKHKFKIEDWKWYKSYLAQLTIASG